MERLLNVVAGFSLALFVFVLFSLRRAHIRVEYSVSWLAASVALFTASRFPGALRSFTAAIGLSDPAVALLIMVLCVFLVVFYRLSVIVSQLKDNNIALAQKVAILEYEIGTINEVRQTRQS